MRTFSLFILFFSFSFLTIAQPSLPKVFSNNMVLQRNIKIPIWGTATAGSEIVVEIAGNKTVTRASNNGNWMVKLPEFEAGGPYELRVYYSKLPKKVVSFTDVLIGDVWLASGQSNMEWQVQQSNNADYEISKANYPNIRFFNVQHAKSLVPETDVLGGTWKVCDTNSVRDVSAVAYYFSRKVHADINVPIGILQTTWGGTPVEAWTSREKLLSSYITRQTVLNNDSLNVNHFIKDSLDLVSFWYTVYTPDKKVVDKVTSPIFDDTKWKELEMPKTIKDWGIPFYEGMVWLRKAIDLPDSFMGKELTLNLGHPEMNYSLYFNENEVCKTIWNANLSHYYTIPASWVINKKNTVEVRLAALWGGGGFNKPAEQMYITNGTDTLPLSGTWKYQNDLETPVPKIYNYQYYPCFLFNAMVNPVIPYGLKGFLWYQGEANDSLAYYYRETFPMLISDWRSRWQQGNLPFIYVQLANFMKTQSEPSESQWAELREAQTMALSQSETAMACIIDIGETNTIHPTNKQEVGRRIALAAENLAYKLDTVYSGPVYTNYTIEESAIRISFNEIAQGLHTKDNAPLKGFAIAGADKKFYWATAVIEGDQVIVRSNKVANPIAVRYAWGDNPICNLINSKGLPAIPFRTDTWKGITQK